MGVDTGGSTGKAVTDPINRSHEVQDSKVLYTQQSRSVHKRTQSKHLENSLESKRHIFI